MKNFWIALFLIFGIGIGYFIFRFTISQGLINMNSVNVVVEKPLDKDKVKVILSLFSINRKNDAELFFNWNKKDIIFDKEVQTKPKTGDFENDFLIIYDNRYYFQFRHMKIDVAMNESFNLKLVPKDSLIILQVNIKPHGMEFTRPMIPISHAARYIANTPLDSAHDSYNGIDLRGR